MKNLELLIKVRDKIASEPLAHDQDHWGVIQTDLATDLSPGDLVECTTAACVAGWACQINGDRAMLDDTIPETVELADGTEINVYTTASVVDSEGTRHHISARARELLGLDYSESDRLFDGDNSTQQVLVMLDEIIAEAAEERANFDAAVQAEITKIASETSV